MKAKSGVVGFSRGSVGLLGIIGAMACSDVGAELETTAVTRQGLSYSTVTVADATIMSGLGNVGANPNCSAKSALGSFVRSCLMRWNLTAIPPGSTVTSATITLQVTDISLQPFNAYRVLPAWSELQATWALRQTGITWQIPGATGPGDRDMIMGPWIFPGAAPQDIVLDQTGLAVVKSWVDFPGTNRGIIIASDTATDTVMFASRENLDPIARPRLTVEYVPPSGTGGGAGGPGTGGTGGIGGRSG